MSKKTSDIYESIEGLNGVRSFISKASLCNLRIEK